MRGGGWAVLVVAFVTASACDSSATRDTRTPGTGGLDASTAAPGTQEGFHNADPNDRPPLGPPPDAAVVGNVQENGCRSIESRASGEPVRQADLVVVLDNSGQMIQEIDQVRDNLNGFVKLLVNGDIDVRVVMISAALAQKGWLGVCIPAPLGSGNCPDDTNPPAYTHVSQHMLDTEPPIVTDIFVQNSAVLDQFMYTFSQWRNVLRPGAPKNFVVISDSNATTSAAYFTAWANSQPEFVEASWRFHGVFCLDDTCAQPDKWDGARIGTVYHALVDATSGVKVQISDTGFDGIFEKLANDLVAVTKPVPCTWKIPEPPEGKTLDPDEVNVRFTGEDAAEQTILGLGNEGDCDMTGGGWYYDDPKNPTRVSVCDRTCDVMRVQPNAKVDIAFGCARELDPRVE